jgi:hypothetical protein
MFVSRINLERRIKEKVRHVSLILIVCAFSLTSIAAQSKSGREDVSEKEVHNKSTQPKKTQPTSRVRKHRIEEQNNSSSVNQTVLFAGLTISANPPGSEILLNGQAYSARDEKGNLVLTDLKPGSYTIVARKAGYRDQSRTVNLDPKQQEYLAITLDPLPGIINIKPSVAGAEITISNLETDAVIGRYTDQVAGALVNPGRYQVSISKGGYQTMVREITINPADSIYLEPSLETLKVSKTRVHSDALTSIDSQRDGKYLIIGLTGKSGDESTNVGTLDVTVNNSDNGAQSVTGMLPGLPCEIDFVRIENVAEYSLKESPGPSNQWGRVVVRVRPKDSKRPIHFSINWKKFQDQ